jgi:hypothetical protein
LVHGIDTAFVRPLLRSLVRPGFAVVVVCRAGRCQAIDTYFPTLRTYGVYMLDINQGNYLSQDMVDKLKVGMTKAQVRQQLGTPLVVSPLPRQPLGLRLRIHAPGRGARASDVHRLLRRRQARAMGRRRNADLRRRAQQVGGGDHAARAPWSDPRSWWEQFLDIFKK